MAFNEKLAEWIRAEFVEIPSREKKMPGGVEFALTLFAN